MSIGELKDMILHTESNVESLLQQIGGYCMDLANLEATVNAVMQGGNESSASEMKAQLAETKQKTAEAIQQLNEAKTTLMNAAMTL